MKTTGMMNFLRHDNDEAAEEEVESVQRKISKGRVTPELK